MCFKILVLTIVTVSASKTKDDIRVQYLGPPKTNFENDRLRPGDSDTDRQFGGSEFEERYKLAVPNFENHRTFNKEHNHRQFQEHNKDNGFENFGRDFSGQASFASGSTERNYRKATETGFRQNTHEIRPLILGNLDHNVGFESSDKEVRVRDRSIEHNRRHSSNNFKHDNSFQGSSQTFYSSGSDSFQTESLGNNQREFNSRVHQGGHGNNFKSHDFENSNRRSESSYRDFGSDNQRESENKDEKQFEIIIDTNRKTYGTENVGRESDFDQHKGVKENFIVSTTETAPYNRNHKNSNDESYQENTNSNHDDENLHTNERGSRRDSEENYGSRRITDQSRNAEEEMIPRTPDNNRRLPEEHNHRNTNNEATTQYKDEHLNGSSTTRNKDGAVNSASSVGRKINHDSTNQRVDNNKANKTKEGDDWIWGEERENMTTTTKLPDLDERAAFAGDKCPTGKVKVGNTCVTPD